MKKGEEDLTTTIVDLKPSQQDELLKCAVIWNTNARNFQVAQVAEFLAKNNCSRFYLG